MSLKAGTSPRDEADFSSPAASMAATIEDEFDRAWQSVHGSALPAAGRTERRILFVAVARGVLRYLSEHERPASGGDPGDHFANRIRFQAGGLGGSGGGVVTEVDWNFDLT